MKTQRQRISSGQRVAHRSIDNEIGSANAGVVEDVIGDDDQQLVVLREEGGAHTAYDRRELVSLGGAKRTRGPVVLSPHHLFNLMKRLPALLAMTLALLAGIALNIFADRGDWSVATIAAVAAAILAACLVIFALLERALVRGDAADHPEE